MSSRTATIKTVVLGDVDQFKKSMADVSEEAADTGDKVKRDLGEGFDKLGEGAGGAEQKFIGFRDTITGTSDVMEGLRSGNVVTLATGLADLAGAAESLWAGFGKVITQTWAKITATSADTAATGTNIISMTAHKIASFASAAASQAWAGAQWLLNAALSANPIALVVIGITALIAAVILAWQHSETFRNIVTAAFDAVLAAVKWVWNWISDNWPTILTILTGPIGLAVRFIMGHWDEIKAGVTGVYDWIVDKFTAVVGFFEGINDRIGAIASGMWDGIKDAFRGAINAVISIWNGISFPSIDTHIPGVGKVGGFSVPQISYFANGALVKGGQGGVLGMVGEGRSDELIVPLDRAGAVGGLGTTINLTVHAPVGSSARDIGRGLQGHLNEYLRAS